MKIRIYYGITLTLLSFALCLAPGWAQNSYRVNINGQAFIVTGSTNQLIENIYKRIKPSGNPKPTITLPLGNTNLKSFQTFVKSKGISAQYYEVQQVIFTGKDAATPINPSSILSNNKNYGVILSKSGYAKTEIIPFKVTQTSNNTPALSFSRSTLFLLDKSSISFIVDTSNTGLDRNQIGNALNSRDTRLSMSRFRNFQEYQSCLNMMPTNPAYQANPCGRINFVINISH